MPTDRRPLAVRAARWPHALAASLVRLGLSPNQVSVLSVVFSLGGAAMFVVGSPISLVLAACAIQGRLVCNLIDGLMAVEGGLKSPTGELFNEVPDRVADSVFFVAAGYVNPELAWLGWLAALGSVGVAYTRVLGAALTGHHDFCGPMAKQHRMFALTVGAVVAAAELLWSTSHLALPATLAIVSVGSIGTFIRRLRRIAGRMSAP